MYDKGVVCCKIKLPAKLVRHTSKRMIIFHLKTQSSTEYGRWMQLRAYATPMTITTKLELHQDRPITYRKKLRNHFNAVQLRFQQNTDEVVNIVSSKIEILTIISRTEKDTHVAMYNKITHTFTIVYKIMGILPHW